MNYAVHRTPIGSTSGVLSIQTSGGEPFRLLFDCGLRFEEQSEQYIAHLRDIAPKLDAIVLSNGLLSYCGALPYISHRLKPSCKVYATLPTVKFAKLVCTDFVYSASFCPEKAIIEDCATAPVEKTMGDAEKQFANLYTPADVENSFTADKVQIVHWGERKTIISTSEPEQEIVLQAFPSGYGLSGTLWRIAFPKSGQCIVYSTKIGSIEGDFLCPRFQNDAVMRQCHALVAESQPFQSFRPAESVRVLPKPDSCEPGFTEEGNSPFNVMLEKVIETLFVKNGTVLIPTDVGDRMAGILVLMNSMWKLKGFEKYPVVVLSHTAKSFVGTAKSLTNYASEGIQNAIFDGKDNALDFTKTGQVIPVESMDEFNQRLDPEMPKVIVATPASLQYGFSQELLLRYGRSDSNAILFESPPETGSVAHQLMEAPLRRITVADTESLFQRGSAPVPKARSIYFYLKRRVCPPLSLGEDENRADANEDGAVGAALNVPEHPVERVNEEPLDVLDENIGTISEPNVNRMSPSEPEYDCPAGLYLSASVRKRLAKDPSQSILPPSGVSTSYGELLSTSLLDAWGVKRPVYFAENSVVDNFSQMLGGEPYESSFVTDNTVKPLSVQPVRSSHRYALNASSYESYRVSLQVSAEVLFSNLSNAISAEHYVKLLKSAPASLEKCCLIGKISQQLKNFIDTGTVMPLSKIWHTEKQADNVSLGIVHSPLVDIDINVLSKGIRYYLSDPIWEITSMRGTVVKNDTQRQLLRKLRRKSVEEKSTSLLLRELSASDNTASLPSIFVGDSSVHTLANSLRSADISIDSHDDTIVANDTCLIQARVNSLRVEEIASFDALVVQDTVLNQYVQI